ncbi:MAG TPA: HypC/HybG/HupF family hydrogenase formation chaperone [Candidatus Limnocylindrales bacterium]|jgi:hydrogenase maturation factor
MCAAVEAMVVEVAGDAAVVEWDGRRRRATTLLLPDVRAGERVLVAFGSILGRVTTGEPHRSTTRGRTFR